MAVTLVLDSIVFADFEIPEEIPFGGAQVLAVKKLVGGARVIDAMGRDDMNIGWSGRFRGEFGEARARTLDTMRVQGRQLILTWSTLRYLVVIERFTANFRQPFEIPYSISCTVIEDLSLPILEAAPDPNAMILADVASALSITGVDASVVGAVSGVSVAVQAVDNFQGADIGSINSVESAIQVAQTSISARAAIQNATVAPNGSVAGMFAGTSPAALAATLTQQAGAFSELSQLYQLQALMGRTSVNVQNAGS